MHKHPTIDAHQIAAQLWQGSQPATGRELADAGFTALVLCAEEYQPRSRSFPNVHVYHAPNDDAKRLPSAEEGRIAMAAAQWVAGRILLGDTVLVTCHAGRNRSGLVSALALWRLTGKSIQACAQRVMKRRPLALTNRYFLHWLQQVATS